LPRLYNASPPRSRILFSAPAASRLGSLLCAGLFFALAAPTAFATQAASPPVPTYDLRQCLQLALDHNPDILKAQHEIERTQGLIVTAKSTLYPQVSVNGRIEERNDDLFSQGTDPTIQRFRDFWTIQLTVTQSLYSGGTNRQQIAISKLEHEAALIQLRATMDTVLKKVKYAVYDIVVNQAQIDAGNQTVQLLEQEETRQKSLFDAGRTTRFSVLRTEVSLGNQRSALLHTQNNLVSSEISLSQLLGQGWDKTGNENQPPFLIHESLDCPPVGAIQVDDFVNLALARRPELQVIDRQIEIDERRIKIDKAALVPRVDAFASDEEFRDQSQASFNASQNNYGVGLLGTWNVFDGFASKGQTTTDTSVLSIAHISRDDTRLQIENEVREAYARLMNATKSIEAQAANVHTAEESLRLAHVSADNGYATLLDVLQATLDLTAARTEAIRTREIYLDALADLERAISLKFTDWPESSLDVKADEAPTLRPPANHP
jgi:outer membrane protein TolC